MHMLFITIDLRKYTDTEYSKTTLVSSVLLITDSIISTFLCKSPQLFARTFCPSSTFNSLTCYNCLKSAILYF